MKILDWRSEEAVGEGSKELNPLDVVDIGVEMGVIEFNKDDENEEIFEVGVWPAEVEEAEVKEGEKTEGGVTLDERDPEPDRGVDTDLGGEREKTELGEVDEGEMGVFAKEEEEGEEPVGVDVFGMPNGDAD